MPDFPKLTNYLEDWRMTDVPMHPEFPGLPSPEGAVVKGHEVCLPCPIYQNNTTDGHKSPRCQKLSGPVDDESLIHLQRMRHFQNLVRSLYLYDRALMGLITLLNGSGSVNFLDGVLWEIVSVTDRQYGCDIRVRNPGGNSQRVGIITSDATRLGIPQPGDVIEFQAPSVLAGKASPRVRTVELIPPDEAIFSVAQKCLNARESSAFPVPETFYLATMRQAGDPERWNEIVQLEPSVMHTKLRTATFESVPENGQFVLKAHGITDGAIGEPTAERFVCEKLVAGEWVDISAAAREKDGNRYKRIFVDRTGPGDDGLGTFKTTVYLGAADPYAAALDNLVTDATAVRFMYWAQAKKGSAGSCAQDVGRCGHCKLDHTNSTFGNALAEAWDEESRHWYCDYRDSPGQVMPRGVTEGHFGGNCMALGHCAGYRWLRPAPTTEEPDAMTYFTVARDLAPWMARMWYAQTLRILQLSIGSSSHRSSIIARVMHAGMSMLYRQRDLGNGSGNFQKAHFPEQDGGYHGPTSIYTDENNDQYFQFLRGAFEDADQDLSLGAAGPGVLPTLLPEWTERDSPFGVAHDGVTDPNGAERLHDFRGGVRIQRGSGALIGRFANRYAKLMAAEKLLCPAIDLNRTGLQERGFVTARQLVPPEIRDEVEYDFELQVRPLIQVGKEAETVVEGIIDSVSVVDGVATFQIRNGRHYTGRDTLGGGRVVDSWEAGGTFVRPSERRSVFSPEEQDYAWGPNTDLCRCGDALIFPDVPALSDTIVDVLSSAAFAGAPAAGWGPTIREALGYVTGFWEPTGLGESRVPPEFTFVQRVSDNVFFTRLTGSTRPATIGAEEYWVDPQTSWFYISESDKGVALRGGGVFQPEFVEFEETFIAGHNVTYLYESNNAAFDTTFPSIEDATILTLDGATITVSEDPPVSGSTFNTATDSAGNVVLLLHLDDAGKRIRVVVPNDEEVPSPGDVTYEPGYGTGDEFGRNMDVVKARDENGQIAANADALPGERIVCKRNLQVAAVTDDFEFQATLFQVDTYSTISSGDYLWWPGKGRLLLRKAKSDALRAVGAVWCFLFRLIRRWDHRCIPPARMFNMLIDALQNTQRLHQALPIGPGPPLIMFTMKRKHVFSGVGQFAADCGDFGNWKLRAGEVWAGTGLSYADAMFVATQRAHDLRFLDKVQVEVFGDHENVPDYGIIDRSNVQPGDLTLSGSCPQVPTTIIRYVGPQSGVGPPVPDPFVSDLYYNESPFEATDLSGEEVTTGNWIDNGYAAPQGCPPNNTWFFALSTGIGGTISQPGWGCGIVGDGLLFAHPRTTEESGPFFGNYIGGFAPEAPGAHPAPGSAIHIGSHSGGFSFSELMKKINWGSTIHEAKIRIKIGGFQSHDITTTQVGHPWEVGNEIVTTDDTTTRCSLILVAGFLADYNTGAWQWDALATGIGGEVVSDKFVILDCTDIVQAIVDEHRDSRYTHFFLAPGPALEAFGSANPRTLTPALDSTFSYDFHLREDRGDLEWYAGDEGPFIRRSRCKYVRWSNMVYESIDFVFSVSPPRFPQTGNAPGTFLVGNLPPFD